MSAGENAETPPPSSRGQEIGGVPSEETVGELTVWVEYEFAPEWLEDARREARTAGHNARRREVVFAVCFAESYLFEWVRDQVLDKRDFGQLVKDLNYYFPPAGRKRAIREKWKEVPKRLFKDGRITGTPDPSQRDWENFLKLLDIRN